MKLKQATENLEQKPTKSAPEIPEVHTTESEILKTVNLKNRNLQNYQYRANRETSF